MNRNSQSTCPNQSISTDISNSSRKKKINEGVNDIHNDNNNNNGNMNVTNSHLCNDVNKFGFIIQSQTRDLSYPENVVSDF
ncbi:unnamed protein product [Heterobilharzia americana]|nr:unnamed protein product [Heterobilharzia americana]